MSRSIIVPIAAALSTLLAAAPAAAQMGDMSPAALLARSDLNGDGQVTRAEFDRARAERFRTFDRNRDGHIDRSDFGMLLRLRPGAGEKLGTMISLGDKNADGRLSRAEYDAIPPIAFSMADTDHDGLVSRAELKAAQAKQRP
jgi:Ca2+-binding EF-hand superfamily protein